MQTDTEHGLRGTLAAEGVVCGQPGLGAKDKRRQEHSTELGS